MQKMRIILVYLVVINGSVKQGTTVQLMESNACVLVVSMAPLRVYLHLSAQEPVIKATTVPNTPPLLRKYSVGDMLFSVLVGVEIRNRWLWDIIPWVEASPHTMPSVAVNQDIIVSMAQNIFVMKDIMGMLLGRLSPRVRVCVVRDIIVHKAVLQLWR